MKTLVDAWEWYVSTRRNLERLRRLGKKGWNELRRGRLCHPGWQSAKRRIRWKWQPHRNEEKTCSRFPSAKRSSAFLNY